MASPAEVVCGKKWHLDYDVHYGKGTIGTFCGLSQVVCSAHLGLVCVCISYSFAHKTVRYVRTYWLNPATYEFDVVSTAVVPAWLGTMNVGYVGADSSNMIVTPCTISMAPNLKVVNVMNDTFVELQTITCTAPRSAFENPTMFMNPWCTAISNDGNRMAMLYAQLFGDHDEIEVGNFSSACFNNDGAAVVVFERSPESLAWLPRWDQLCVVNKAYATLVFLNGGSKLFIGAGGVAGWGKLWDIKTGTLVDIPRAAYGSCGWCGSAALSRVLPAFDRVVPYNDCCVLDYFMCPGCLFDFPGVIRVCAKADCNCCPLPPPVRGGRFCLWQMPYELGLASSLHNVIDCPNGFEVLAISMVMVHPKAYMTFVRTAWMCAVVRACIRACVCS